MKSRLVKKSASARRRRGLGIDDSEWEFNETSVPSQSVIDCLNYEYAREFIRRTPEAAFTLRNLQAARASGDAEQVCFCHQRLALALKTKNANSVLIYEYMDEVSWIGFQRLLEKEKRARIQKKNRGLRRQKKDNNQKTQKSQVIHLGGEQDADELLFWGTGLALLKNPPFEPGKLYERFSRSIRSANVGLGTDVRKESCGFFAVDLKATIPELLVEFENWIVLEKKRAGIVDAERRGGITDTKRAYTWLNALGAYRLMSMTGMSVEAIIDALERLGRPLPYSNAPEWSRAKNTVDKALQLIFEAPTEAVC